MSARVWAEHPIDPNCPPARWLEFWSWREPRRRGWIRRRTEWRWAVGNVLTRYHDTCYRDTYEYGSAWGWADTEDAAIEAIQRHIDRARWWPVTHPYPYKGGEVR